MPRTDTSDPPGAELGPASNVFRLWALAGVTSTVRLYQNVHQGAFVVVTSMDLFNRGGSSGDSAFLSLYPQVVGIFGGQIGAGTSDTFSWRGHLALAAGESIQGGVITGIWDTVGSGYLSPAYVSS